MSNPRRHSGQPPYGYRWDEDRLEIEPNEAKVRKLAFALFAQHKRKGAVARLLNEAGHRPRRGPAWRDVTIGRLLNCTSARGEYAVKRTTTDEAGKRVERPKDDWEFIKCPRIVSKQLWNEVANILKEQEQRRAKVARPPTHTFTGLAVCWCGGSMVVPKGSGKYTCSRPGCPVKIPVTDLEGVFEDELRAFLDGQFDLLQEIVQGGPKLAQRRRSLEEVEDEIERTEANVNKNHGLYLDEKLTLQRFGALHEDLETRLANLTSEASALRKEVKNQEGDAKNNSGYLDLDKLADGWAKLGTTERRQIVEVLVERIVVGDGEIAVSYRIAPPQPQVTSQPNKFPSEVVPTSKDGTNSQHTGDPTNSLTRSSSDDPYFIRLPKTGEVCPLTGLTRSKLNELILPSGPEGEEPPVKSISIKREGQQRGVRLIYWESLKRYLQNHQK